MLQCLKSFFAQERNFRIVYIVSLFFVSFLLIDAPLMAFSGLILVTWGTFLVAKRLKKHASLEAKGEKIPLVFLASATVTCIINMNLKAPLNFCYDLILVLFAAVCFLVFYSAYLENDFPGAQRELIIIGRIVIIFTTLANAFSLVFIMLHDSIYFKHTLPFFGEIPYPFVLGVIQELSGTRLSGVYTNPNILAFCAVVACIFGHILLNIDPITKKIGKTFSYIVLFWVFVVNFVALILSDSVASFLFLALYATIFVFYHTLIHGTINFSWKVAMKTIVFLLVSVAIMLSFFSARTHLQVEISEVISEVHSASRENDDFDLRFGRPHHDIRNGSGRRNLLFQGFSITKQHPIFGVGSANLLSFNKSQAKYPISSQNLHNGYLSVLVSFGVLGLGLFLAFLLVAGFFLGMFFFRRAGVQKNSAFACLFAAAVSYGVFALFEKTMISEMNFMSIFFWAVLGYAMVYIKKFEPELLQ